MGRDGTRGSLPCERAVGSLAAPQHNPKSLDLAHKFRDAVHLDLDGKGGPWWGAPASTRLVTLARRVPLRQPGGPRRSAPPREKTARRLPPSSWEPQRPARDLPKP